MLGTRAIQAVAVLVDRHLRHDRQFGIHVAGGQNRLMQLFEISEGFQDQQIDAFFIQRRNLLAKCVASFGQRDLAQRLDPDSQRSHCSGDQRVEVLRCLAGQPRSVAIDFDQLVHTSVLRQPKRIRAEGVCFNDLGSGLQVVLMNAANEVGRGEIQFVVTAIDEDTFGVEQGTHGAVA